MRNVPGSIRLWRGGLAALVVLFAGPLTASELGASPARPGTADQVGETATDVDLLRADAEEVRTVLAATRERRVVAETELRSARAAIETAEAAVAEAEAAEAVAQRTVDRVDAEVRQAAVGAFVGNGAPLPLGILSSNTAGDAAWQGTVLEYRAEELEQLLDRQRVAQHHLQEQRAAREEAADAAAAASDVASARVNDLVELENRQAELVAQVEDRLDAALAEAEAIAAIDAQASARLVDQEQSLRDAVAMNLSPTAPSPSPAAAPTTTTAPPLIAVAAPPTPPAPTAPRPPSTTTPPSPTRTTIPAGPPPAVDLTTVGGFTVATSLAGPLRSLLDAAAGAGFSLAGSGYRDINTQIALRRAHCGTTDYDIWQRPASQCSPPTAIPGRSMHEKGLAVDFTCNGPLLSSRSHPCFAWLAANASQYGFYNLPSEPWHWSTNGN